MKENQIEEFCQFIRVIQSRIDEHFEKQKEYIHCKEGCAYCCKNGEYPCSELEFEFIKLGFMALEKEIQQKIIDKVLKLKAEKAVFTGEKFIYECPFLLDNKCSIYKYRMIICRTFGLSYYDKGDEKKKNTLKVPFCMHQGLNYSEVYDPQKKTFSTELYKQLGYKNEPMAYNLGVEALMEKFGKEIMNLDFGEIKTLLDWL
jgi:Fe-S-cluster containining protein